eukprot:170224_1
MCAKRDSLVLVSNIPSCFRSHDVRSFFNSYVEAGNFDVFHYRHRPQIVKRKDPNDPSKSLQLPVKCCCCVVKLKRYKLVSKFIEAYQNKRWHDANGDYRRTRAKLTRVVVHNSVSEPESKNDEATSPGELAFLSREKIRERAAEKSEKPVSENDVRHLPELNPPIGLPHGNVGTSRRELLRRMETLPTSVIRKLGPLVSRTPATIGREYGAVPLSYARKRAGLSPEDSDDSDLESKFLAGRHDDSEAEEWERHESMHPVKSVSYEKKDRLETEEKLFEEKTELIWDKGDASGLVYYTDAIYWDALKGGFDERLADDWDTGAPISPHRKKRKIRALSPPKLKFSGRGNDVAPDVCVVRADKSDGHIKSAPGVPRFVVNVRTHNEVASATGTGVGTGTGHCAVGGAELRADLDGILGKRGKEEASDQEIDNEDLLFEKYTMRGFGGQHLRSLGWEDGQGVGKDRQGITKAVEVDPSQKRQGIGYREDRRSFTAVRKDQESGGIQMQGSYSGQSNLVGRLSRVDSDQQSVQSGQRQGNMSHSRQLPTNSGQLSSRTSQRSSNSGQLRRHARYGDKHSTGNNSRRSDPCTLSEYVGQYEITQNNKISSNQQSPHHMKSSLEAENSTSSFTNRPNNSEFLRKPTEVSSISHRKWRRRRKTPKNSYPWHSDYERREEKRE